jgi:penicillin-binding protein 1C
MAAHENTTAQPPRRWRKRYALIVAALACGVALATVFSFRAAVAWLPYSSDTVFVPQRCTWIEDRAGNCLAAFVPASNQWDLPLTNDQVSPHLLNAIVAIEDRRFYQHHGVDWRAAAGALVEDLLHCREQRGASTLTMQLYRIGHPTQRSIWAKFIQAIRAEQIEEHLDKQAILLDYVNSAPFGGNLVGAGAASWRYFDRPCSDLSLGEAALLAGLPQNPKALRPDRFPERAMWRRNRVLGDMLALGMIDGHQHAQAIAEPIEAKWHPLPQESEVASDSSAVARNPLGLLPLLTELAQQQPGHSVRTTIDQKIQREAASAVSNALAQLAPSHITASAVIVLDTQTAQCLASVSLSTVGGTESIDLTHRPRSSGSTLKPFIYAAAFDAGICTPQSILNDSPTSWAGYAPQDYDRDFVGPLTAADALAQSRNVPAMSLLSNVGVERAIDVMAAAGLTTLSKHSQPYGLPLAIGGADVTPMELAEAYATLARGGLYRPATILANVSTPSASSAKSRPDRVALRPESCLSALYCLADPDRTEQVCISAAALSPAWKTGTSSGHRDAWCVAVTRRRTVVAWLGNADGTGSDALVGQDVAAPLALKILAATDPGGSGFAPPSNFHAEARPARTGTTAEVAKVAMISPVNGQEIVRDPSLPPDRQKLSLRASAPRDQRLWWFIDQQCLGQCKSSQNLWWDPTPGDHEIRVVAEKGQAASANIHIQ